MSSITVGVYLGKKDRLVRYWYEILPKGQFPMLVKYCIQSYLRNNYFPLQSICDARQLKEQIQKEASMFPPSGMSRSPRKTVRFINGSKGWKAVTAVRKSKTF